MPQNASQLRHVVTAVIVAHDGARLLPALVRAVREQTHPAYRVVGVDTGSLDRSGAALTELLGQDAVFGMDSDTGFGAAVSRALQHPAARRPAPAAPQAPQAPPAAPAPAAPAAPPGRGALPEWIWLLHDDCEPEPDALEQLLRVAAARGPSTAVLGPKLRDGADRRVVREAGFTTDKAGRRVTAVEPGEIDQGQHDGQRAVVAVSSCGMLVRRDVWDQLGGFDPDLPLFRDDMDFCWRAHAAGYEVRVVTDAVVYHRELSARQIRPAPAAGGHPRLLDRRSALYVFAVNLPLLPMLVVVGGCLVGSLLRAAWYLLTKQQRKAAAQLGAMAWVLRHPLRLRAARRSRAADRKHGYAVMREQLPGGRIMGRLGEAVIGVLSRSSSYETGGLHHAPSIDPDDELPLPDHDSVLRQVLTSPGVLLFVTLAVIALIAERALASSVLSGSGTLAGGALVPAWGGASGLWREYLAGFHATGVGSAASAPPYLAVVAALATVLAGKPWLAVDVLLLGCVPAAGVTAFLASRRLTTVLPVRVWLAASYALLPVAMGAVAAGRLGTVAAFVLLPLIGITTGRMLTGPARAARRAAWATGLLVAITASFVPLAWPLAVAAAVVAAGAWRWLGPRTVLNAVIVALVPAVLLVPWTFHLVTSPSAFLLEAGLTKSGLSASHLGPKALLLLSPGGPGLPPVWVTAGLVLPALAALLARRRMILVCAGWAVALTGLAVGLAESRVLVPSSQGGASVSAWPGFALALAAAGLLLAAAPLGEAAVTGFRRGVSRVTRLAMLAGFAVAASAPLLAAGSWLATGVSGPVGASAPQVLPAFVAASSTGPDRPRTLVLRQESGTLAYTVLRTSDPLLGEPELAGSVSATSALNVVVAALGAAGGGDAGNTGQALGQFDIGYVLMPAPINQPLASQLDAAAGLQLLTQAPGYDLWQVSGPVARVRVITSAGTVLPVASGTIGASTVLSPGTSGTLVLAEPAGGWSATLDGKALTPLAHPVDGWAQGYPLPAGGGRLVITRNETARDLSLAIEAAALAVVFALALPGTRSSLAPVPADAAAEADTGRAGAERPGAGRRRERAHPPRTRPGRLGRPRPAPAPAPAPEAIPETLPAPDSVPAPEPVLTPAAYPQPGYSDPAYSDAGTIPPAPAPVPARPRRGGQHAAKHGKPSKRRRGDSS